MLFEAKKVYPGQFFLENPILSTKAREKAITINFESASYVSHKIYIWSKPSKLELGPNWNQQNRGRAKPAPNQNRINETAKTEPRASWV